jgi:molecular chaperone DnaJ
MKDYYSILGVAPTASLDEIKSTFRNAAFKYHPDTNPGHEKEATEIFKEINEAFAILSSPEKRQAYDQARQSPFSQAACYGEPGSYASQQDIFRDSFGNQVNMEELNHIFRQAGLRFDQSFINHVLFNNSNGAFYSYTPNAGPSIPSRKPNFVERALSRVILKLGRFAFRQMTGISPKSPSPDLDCHQDLEISAAEARNGCEKSISFRRGRQAKKLLVRIPPLVTSGARIRLRGMGSTRHRDHGDLYLHVKIRA